MLVHEEHAGVMGHDVDICSGVPRGQAGSDIRNLAQVILSYDRLPNSVLSVLSFRFRVLMLS